MFRTKFLCDYSVFMQQQSTVNPAAPLWHLCAPAQHEAMTVLCSSVRPSDSLSVGNKEPSSISLLLLLTKSTERKPLKSADKKNMFPLVNICDAAFTSLLFDNQSRESDQLTLRVTSSAHRGKSQFNIILSESSCCHWTVGSVHHLHNVTHNIMHFAAS